jgi:hypothetical protein
MHWDLAVLYVTSFLNHLSLVCVGRMLSRLHVHFIPINFDDDHFLACFIFYGKLCTYSLVLSVCCCC